MVTAVVNEHLAGVLKLQILLNIKLKCFYKDILDV